MVILSFEDFTLYKIWTTEKKKIISNLLPKLIIIGFCLFVNSLIKFILENMLITGKLKKI